MNLHSDISTILKKEKKIVVPTKRSINFVEVGQKRSRLHFVVPVCVGCVLLIGVFCFFFVIKPIQQLNEIHENVDLLQSELTLSYNQLQEYNSLDSEYAHYSYNGFSEEEMYLPNREVVVDLIYRIILPKSSVAKWMLQDSILYVSIVESDVKTINSIATSLENEDIVSYCDIQMAEKTDGKMDAQLTIYLW